VSACSAAGLTPHIVQEVSDESIGLNFIGTGSMIGLVTSSALGRRPQSVVLRRVADLSIPMYLEFAWRKDNKHPALLVFAATVTEHAKKVPSAVVAPA
jgi:hypothetical protein